MSIPCTSNCQQFSATLTLKSRVMKVTFLKMNYNSVSRKHPSPRRIQFSGDEELSSNFSSPITCTKGANSGTIDTIQSCASQPAVKHAITSSPSATMGYVC